MRDRDVMNLLDQLELYTLKIGGEQVSQKGYWLYVYKSMKSGLLMTKSLENHIRYKLKGLGVDLGESQFVDSIRTYQGRTEPLPAMTLMMEEKDMRQCDAVCPKHGVRCKLNNFEQNAFPMHAHSNEGKTCVWKK